MLKLFAKNFWVASQKQSFLGLEMGTRMSVVDITGQGDLLLHSPIQLTPSLQEEFQKLGRVTYVIAPNKMHHLYVQSYLDQYPNAQLFLAPGLEKKRPELKEATVIAPNQDYPWAQAFDYCLIEGCPLLNEVAFFHKQSNTLVLTDTGLHIGEESPFMTRWIFKVMGAYKKFGLSRMEKKIFIKDQKTFHESIAKILQWDFQKIMLAHGKPIEMNGHRVFREAYQNNRTTN